MVVAMAMTVAFAQNNDNRGERRGPRQMDATEMTNRMSERLGLNDKQKTQVLELNKDFVKTIEAEMKNRRDAENDRQKQFETMRKNHEKYESELKKILTDDQYKQYQQMRQRPQGQRRGRGFGRPGGPGPRPTDAPQPQSQGQD